MCCLGSCTIKIVKNICLCSVKGLSRKTRVLQSECIDSAFGPFYKHQVYLKFCWLFLWYSVDIFQNIVEFWGVFLVDLVLSCSRVVCSKLSNHYSLAMTGKDQFAKFSLANSDIDEVSLPMFSRNFRIHVITALILSSSAFLVWFVTHFFHWLVIHC